MGKTYEWFSGSGSWQTAPNRFDLVAGQAATTAPGAGDTALLVSTVSISGNGAAAFVAVLAGSLHGGTELLAVPATH